MLKVLLLYCYLLTVFWLTLSIFMPMQLKVFMLLLFYKDTLVDNKILELMKYGKNNFIKFLNKFQVMEVSDFVCYCTIPHVNVPSLHKRAAHRSNMQYLKEKKTLAQRLELYSSCFQPVYCWTKVKR